MFPFAEYGGKIALALESQIGGNLADGACRVFQQVASDGHLLTLNVIMDGNSHFLGKEVA